MILHKQPVELDLQEIMARFRVGNTDPSSQGV
jgi:hypothetical protein